MENNENKAKFSEKISLKMRKRWLVNGSKTFLIVAVLVTAFIALNIWAQGADLPKIDITENQIYTLSDASKKAIAEVKQDVTIYAYGFEERGALIDLLKQYSNVNDKIKYEILTEESNYEMVKENDLSQGYTVLILKSGESKKVIDAASEFNSYDYTTGQSVDTTEEIITNSILALNIENKPKVYFLQGHGEFENSEINVLTTYLGNEAFEFEFINLATMTEVPEDCNVLAMMSPKTDLLDNERDAIKRYIQNGGNIYFSMDVVTEETNLINLQNVLDEYGVSVENGYIIEYEDNSALSNAPAIFMPKISSSNSITSDISSDSYMWLAFAARLKFKSDEELASLSVSNEELLYSSDKAVFVRDLSADMLTAAQNSEIGKSTIASLVTKSLTPSLENAENGEEVDNTKTSKLVITASGSFISDYQIPDLSSNYPLSYLGGNKDFVINSFAKLAEKEGGLTLRKGMSSSTYTPTENENKIVLAIIFVIPLVIILTGIIVAKLRKRRK